MPSPYTHININITHSLTPYTHHNNVALCVDITHVTSEKGRAWHHITSCAVVAALKCRLLVCMTFPTHSVHGAALRRRVCLCGNIYAHVGHVRVGMKKRGHACGWAGEQTCGKADGWVGG